MKKFLLGLVASALLAIGLTIGPATPGTRPVPKHRLRDSRRRFNNCVNTIGPVTSNIRFTCWPGDYYPSCIYN